MTSTPPPHSRLPSMVAALALSSAVCLSSVTVRAAPPASESAPTDPQPAAQSPASTPEVAPEPGPEPSPLPAPEPARPEEGGLTGWDSAPQPEAQPEAQLAPEADPEGGGLPSYSGTTLAPDAFGDTQAAAAPYVVVDIPPNGNGRIATGSLLLGGGAVVFGASLSLLQDTNDPGLWISGMTLGSGSVLTGIIALVAGLKRRRRYRAWALESGESPPQNGVGMRSAGATILITGSVGMVFGGIGLINPDPEDPSYPEVVLGLSAVAMAPGLAALLLGVRRGKGFTRWRMGLEPHVQLQPSFGVLPIENGGGLRGHLGVTGRF